MSPAVIALITQLLEAAIANEPALATDLQNLFSGGNPTAAQWTALRASIAAETYGQFVPGTSLPPGTANS